MNEALHNLKADAEAELFSILNYWQTHTVDEKSGGFYGKIDNNDRVYAESPKGCVLNARILWSFSSAYQYSKNHDFLRLATRAYNYLTDHFIDRTYGGCYWTVTFSGDPFDTKKQLYANAFAVYALSEYYKASRNNEAKQLAISLYHIMFDHGYDHEHGGYFEAFSRNWTELPDQRLSSKDANEKKSMNTNLHVLEAYANLYLIWPDKQLKDQIASLLQVFIDHIIDHSTGHLQIFFDERWHVKPDVVSYGHDVEACWLLLECSKIIAENSLVSSLETMSVKIANAAYEGFNEHGALWYEYDPNKQHLVKEMHWWPQAEAVVGFYNAWQLTGDQKFLNACISCWQFIKNHLRCTSGEWYWGIRDDGSIMDEDKAGIWKCPYHNSRACLEMIRRLP